MRCTVVSGRRSKPVVSLISESSSSYSGVMYPILLRVGRVSTPTVGSVVECIVSETTPLSLVVSAPWWAGFGRIDITDLADEYADHPLEMYREMREGVRCCVVRVAGDQMDLSLRPSRLSTSPPLGDSPDPEITSLEGLPEGSIVRGYVKAVTAVGLFVRLATDTVITESPLP